MSVAPIKVGSWVTWTPNTPGAAPKIGKIKDIQTRLGESYYLVRSGDTIYSVWHEQIKQKVKRAAKEEAPSPTPRPRQDIERWATW